MLFVFQFLPFLNPWLVIETKPAEVFSIDVTLADTILVPKLFLLYINDLSDDVICNIAISADDTRD